MRPNAGPGQVLGAAFAKGPIKCKGGYQTMEATALEIEQVNKWYAADVHAVRAIVTDVERTGRESLLFLNLPGMPVLTAAVGADCALYPGEETGVILDRGRLHFFDRETEQRL